MPSVPQHYPTRVVRTVPMHVRQQQGHTSQFHHTSSAHVLPSVPLRHVSPMPVRQMSPLPMPVRRCISPQPSYANLQHNSNGGWRPGMFVQSPMSNVQPPVTNQVQYNSTIPNVSNVPMRRTVTLRQPIQQPNVNTTPGRRNLQPSASNSRVVFPKSTTSTVIIPSPRRGLTTPCHIARESVEPRTGTPRRSQVVRTPPTASPPRYLRKSPPTMSPRKNVGLEDREGLLLEVEKLEQEFNFGQLRSMVLTDRHTFYADVVRRMAVLAEDDRFSDSETSSDLIPPPLTTNSHQDLNNNNLAADEGEALARQIQNIESTQAGLLDVVSHHDRSLAAICDRLKQLGQGQQINLAPLEVPGTPSVHVREEADLSEEEIDMLGQPALV